MDDGYRAKAYHFMEREMPTWGNCDSLAGIDFDNVTHFLRSSDKTEKDWDDVDDIKRTFDRLGIPEAEQNGDGGVTAIRKRGRLSLDSRGPRRTRRSLP